MVMLSVAMKVANERTMFMMGPECRVESLHRIVRSRLRFDPDQRSVGAVRLPDGVSEIRRGGALLASHRCLNR
jgi:hypothetical protein